MSPGRKGIEKSPILNKSMNTSKVYNYNLLNDQTPPKGTSITMENSERVESDERRKRELTGHSILNNLDISMTQT